MSDTLFWTARNTSGNRWQFEDGWSSELDAHRCAKWYRENYRRRCVVVQVPTTATQSERCAVLRAHLEGDEHELCAECSQPILSDDPDEMHQRDEDGASVHADCCKDCHPKAGTSPDSL